MNETQVGTIKARDNTINDLTFSLKERAYGEVSKIQHDVAATLKEFNIESPTNSIPDMVRAACEVADRLAKHATELEQALTNAKLPSFGSVVEEAVAAYKEHSSTVGANAMQQIVAHILNRDNTPQVGHAPVPNRSWFGGVPRPSDTGC
jgi:hypothetical protein